MAKKKEIGPMAAFKISPMIEFEMPVESKEVKFRARAKVGEDVYKYICFQNRNNLSGIGGRQILALTLGLSEIEKRGIMRRVHAADEALDVELDKSKPGVCEAICAEVKKISSVGRIDELGEEVHSYISFRYGMGGNGYPMIGRAFFLSDDEKLLIIRIVQAKDVKNLEKAKPGPKCRAKLKSSFGHFRSNKVPFKGDKVRDNMFEFGRIG